MTSFLLSLFSGTFTQWFKSKQERDGISSLAKIERSKNAMAGYSDEFLLLVWAMPIVMIFTPYYEIASRGFDRLAILPDWYVGGFISISFAVFGIDKIFKWRGK